MSTEIKQSGRGRPRDPDLEEKVFDVVMRIYATGGWSAITFDAIARESGIGKSSIYRRWDNRADLLRHTLKNRWLRVETIDTGSLRGDLLELAQTIFNNRTGEYALLESWFQSDSLHYPEIRGVISPYYNEIALQARNITRRAYQRGEVPKSLNKGLLMDLVVGAVTNHVVTTPEHLKAKMIRKSPQFLEELINVVLLGIDCAESRE